MEYGKGHVYELMDQGGPTDNREPYFKEAVDEMMRARTLCAKANATLPDDPSYVGHLEELFGRKLDDVRPDAVHLRLRQPRDVWQRRVHQSFRHPVRFGRH